MVHLYLNEIDRYILRKLVQSDHQPKQIADEREDGPSRPYVAEQIKRMVEHGWAEKEATGLYSITELGRRKYAELDDTEIETFDQFTRIYGDANVLRILADIGPMFVTDEGHDITDAATRDKLAQKHDIRREHIDVAVEALAAALRDGEAPGEDVVAEWIAPSDALDEAARRTQERGEQEQGNDEQRLEESTPGSAD